jgi:hypothetical protein
MTRRGIGVVNVKTSARVYMHDGDGARRGMTRPVTAGAKALEANKAAMAHQAMTELAIEAMEKLAPIVAGGAHRRRWLAAGSPTPWPDSSSAEAARTAR